MPIRTAITPDIIELVARLRRWTSATDGDAYLLEGAFDKHGPAVEAAAAQARPLLREAAGAVYQLVLALERAPEYKRRQK